MIDAAANIPEIRRANKAQAAQFFDITLPTLERWLREGAPVVQRGSRGISWILDLRQIAQWKYGSNIGPGGVDPDSLSPQDRKAWYDSEQKRRALQIQDRELIPVAEIERVISTAFSAIAQGLRSLPDNIERRTGCSPEIVEAIERAIDAEMRALAEKLSALGPVDGD
jgi:hypothetical protein